MHFCLQLTVTLCMAALLRVSSGASGSWDYETHEPKTWPVHYKQFCAGAKQSPIDLGIQHSQWNPQIKPFLVLQNTTANDIIFTLKNNGHSIKLTWSDALSIRMGPSDGSLTHTAAQIHWHWGSTNNEGSEHTVNKATSPAEGHLVFFNEQYNNLSFAVDKSLAVLGVFYEVSEKENPLLKLIEPALNNDSVVAPNGKVNLTVGGLSNLNVMSSLFLPTNTEDFYRYEGSLTTPPCYESVLWTVYRQKVPISNRQLQMLRRLKFPSNASMVNNYRPPLSLNPASIAATPRILYRTFDEPSVCSTRAPQTTTAASRASITASVPFAAFAVVAVVTERFTAALALSSI